METTVFSNEEWLPLRLRNCAYEKWILFYFGIALNCPGPLLKTIHHFTPLRLSDGVSHRSMMEIEKSIERFLEFLPIHSLGWIMKEYKDDDPKSLLHHKYPTFRDAWICWRIPTKGVFWCCVKDYYHLFPLFAVDIEVEENGFLHIHTESQVGKAVRDQPIPSVGTVAAIIEDCLWQCVEVCESL